MRKAESRKTEYTIVRRAMSLLLAAAMLIGTCMMDLSYVFALEDEIAEDIAVSELVEGAEEHAETESADSAVLEDSEAILEETETVLEETEASPEESELLIEESELLIEESELVYEESETVFEETEPTLEEAEIVPEESEPTLEESETALEEIEAVPAEPIVLTATDGHSYRVTVVCSPEAGLPENIGLEVVEITPEDDGFSDYLQQSAEQLEQDADEIAYARIFDISLVDGDNPSIHYQPEAGVDVSIRLMDANDESLEQLQVVHFGEEDPEVVETEAEGKTLNFTADSFSVYAIVVAPAPAATTIQTVQTLEEIENGDFCMSITRSGKTYYFRNVLKSGKKCIARTDAGDIASAAVWHFEPTGTENEYYLFTIVGEEIRYIHVFNDTTVELSTDDATAFTANYFREDTLGAFYLQVSGTVSTGLNFSGGNDAFKCYTVKNDDCKIVLSYPPCTEDDPYELDGKSYGLMLVGSGYTGRALMAEAKTATSLKAAELACRTNPLDRASNLFVARNSGITLWTFHSVGGDLYTLSAEEDGETVYLKAGSSGLSLVSEDQASTLQVLPGTGSREGKIRLLCGTSAISCEGSTYKTASNAGDKEWLSLTELSVLTEDDFVVWSARKVSVADESSVFNGSRVVVYTRVWNDADKRYEFFAIDHSGQLVRCAESGDSIQWIGSRVNTLLWSFTEYYYEGTTVPNYYYELKNTYSGKFLAPQIGGSQVFSDEPVGINLNGRRYGDYYTDIVAWDDPYYAYAAITVEGDCVSAGPMAEGGHFYFALMEENDPGQLTEVPTVDHTEYGITMKMVDFGKTSSNIVTVNGGTTTSREQRDVLGNAGYNSSDITAGLTTTDLKANGYPDSTVTGRSLEDLFADAQEVNNLFIATTYNASGYYEFDSTANFASLQADGTFKVYKELGTMDASDKSSLKHGQFMPYNSIAPAYKASVNPENLYSATLTELLGDDPRKYEELLLVRQPNYYFGVEIEAGFVQTENGLDAWGHDIVYEFTGDDDFWLYVDGELVIDLGGIHSAYPGKVNFCTGEIEVKGRKTTLRDVFMANYAEREGLALTDAAVLAYVDDLFTQNGKGQYVFKNYTAHTMKIFFMERGAGASNLHMRFNLASVKPGQVLLSKQISGTERNDYNLAEYAFQIFWQGAGSEFSQLGAARRSASTVTYQNTSVPVKRSASYTPAGGTTYEEVFFLKPGETAAISFPEGTKSYYIRECGVSSSIYDSVAVNGEMISGIAAGAGREDFACEPSSIEDRPRVVFNNHVDASAMRTLSIENVLLDAEGRELSRSEDDAAFKLRLYLGGENDDELSLAYLQPYHVKDENGFYCTWEESLGFVSTGKTLFSALTASEAARSTFTTSPNGAIDLIPAGFTVEIRGLLVGTQFQIEERASEVPAGYALQEYARVDGSYIAGSGDAYNAGLIRDSQDPAVRVINRRGWGIEARKVWTDSDFVSSHTDVFFAVYAGGVLLDGSVRCIGADGMATYFFASLEAGMVFADYEVREVELSGSWTEEQGVVSGFSGVTPKSEGESLLIEAVSAGSSSAAEYAYTVSYEKSEATGAANHVRRDTVTNTREGGIRIVKTAMDGTTPLSGAEFVLMRGSEVLGEFTSDANGLVTVAYLEDGTYTLKETASPSGSQALMENLTIEVSGGVVSVSGGGDAWTLAMEGGMAVLTVKNGTFSFRVIKKDTSTGAALAGVHFALYRQVEGAEGPMKDYFPLDGFEDLVTDASGLLAGVNEGLEPGTYYLVETKALEGYKGLPSDICFAITRQGTVEILSAEHASWLSGEDAGTYTLTVLNGSAPQVAPTDVDLPIAPFAILLAAGLLLGALSLMRRRA